MTGLVRNNELKSEVKRIEERSLTFLKFFSIFWFTLIFFIIQEIDKSSVADKIADSFAGSIFKFTDISGVVTSLFFYILVLLILLVIFGLANISVYGIPSLRKEPKSLEMLLDEKYKDLMYLLKYGFIASMILIFYFSYLYFLGNPTLMNVLNMLGRTIVFLSVLIGFVIGPIWSLIKNIKKWWGLKELLNKVTEIFALFYIILYFGLRQLLTKILQFEFLTFILVIIFLIVFLCTFYRFVIGSIRNVSEFFERN